MPSRIISSRICDSDSLSKLPWFEQVLFLRLIVSVDDFGRFDGRAAVIRGRLFPLEDVTIRKIEDGLALLSRNDMVCLYTVGGRPYISLCAWSRYNTSRAAKSKYPGPDEKDIPCENLCEDSEDCEPLQTDANRCKQMQTDSSVFDIRNSNIDIRNSGENTGAGAPTPPKEKRQKFSHPSVEEVAAYCRERGNRVNAERFVDYYQSNGWKVGKNPMKDWKAAVRSWEGKEEAPRYGKPEVPKGASGVLGEAELEAIRQTLERPVDAF